MLEFNSSHKQKFDTNFSSKSVHLWLCGIDISKREYEGLWTILDEDEQGRALRFRTHELKMGFVACRGWLKLLLAYYRSVPPTSIRFTIGDHGKPRLYGNQPDLGLVFNISHSKKQLAITVGSDCKLGVDVECWRPVHNLPGMVDRCFSESEKLYWHNLAKTDQEQAFFAFWTLKEAISKACGRGLSLGMHRCEFSIQPTPDILSLPSCCGDIDQWTLHRFNCGDKHSGALTVGDTNIQVCYRPLPTKWLFDLYL